jgi:hypothetical protein
MSILFDQWIVPLSHWLAVALSLTAMAFLRFDGAVGLASFRTVET